MVRILSLDCKCACSAALPGMILPITGSFVYVRLPTVALRPKNKTMANKKLNTAPAEITINFFHAGLV